MIRNLPIFPSLALLPALLLAVPAGAEDVSQVIPPSAVIGVQDAMLAPDFWIARTEAPEQLLMTHEEIVARNRESLAIDPSLVDLARIGPTIGRAQILAWLKTVSSPLTAPPVDTAGKGIPPQTLAAIRANIGLDHIPLVQPARFGIAVRRAQLRTSPTSLKAYPSRDLTDFESFEGGTLFPGDAVVILHRSLDGQWLLVQTWQGPVWAATTDIAEGSRTEVLSYAARAPYRVVSGDQVRTVYTPEAPGVSELQLDMGARVPLADLPPDQPVNGEGPYESWTVILPTRAANGQLRLTPALLPKTRDSAPDYLPLTRANIIRQAFKFLGERYGWGYAYNARDCSGFTSDVYRSMGVILPSNSGEQGQGPAFHHQIFTKADSHEARLKAIMAADVGDLIVVPGHVQMILGKVNGQPYIIQDVPYAIFRDATGKIRRTKVNQVSVTPLLPLLFDDSQSYVDAMTSLVHVTAR
jgi:cell wall-associated NlpC family hydrolase